MKNGALVIGAGSWGSAIASALIRSGCETSVLARKRKSVDALADGKCLQLPNCTSNFRINASRDPNLIKPARLIFVAVPVQKNSEVFDLISEKQRGSKAGVIILCAKGISTQRNGNAILLPDLLSEMLPNHPSAILSGPSFADEVFSGLQAALVVASDDPEITAEVQKTFEGSNLRVYRNNDPIGVSVAGAMKNVIAIAAGCAIGAGYGDNAKAAILTRGLAEMRRFAVFMGAKHETIYGLAGVGDLALTCAGPHSRNMAFGIAIGRGETPQRVLAEGSKTVAKLAKLAKTKGIELPITNAVNELVNNGQNLHHVVTELLSRPAGLE